MTRDLSKPRLMPGGSVLVDINPETSVSAINENVWRGRYAELSTAIATPTINVIVKRP